MKNGNEFRSAERIAGATAMGTADRFAALSEEERAKIMATDESWLAWLDQASTEAQNDGIVAEIDRGLNNMVQD
jgi:hypothetical protein